MGNPRKFSRIARRLAMVKPVIVIKPGISRFGAAGSLRVRATDAAPEAFAAMLNQARVIHVENIHQMFDVAQILIHQPRPPDRVGIVGNSAQLCQLAAETAASWNPEIVGEPVTVAPHGSRRLLRRLQTMLRSDEVDSVFMCFTPPIDPISHEALDRIRDVVAHGDKTLCRDGGIGAVGVTTGSGVVSTEVGVVPTPSTHRDARHASFRCSTPEDAARAPLPRLAMPCWVRKDKGRLIERVGVAD